MGDADAAPPVYIVQPTAAVSLWRYRVVESMEMTRLCGTRMCSITHDPSCSMALRHDESFWREGMHYMGLDD